MILLFITFLIASAYGVNPSQSTNQLPFCNICKCTVKIRTGITYTNVICGTKIWRDIYAPELWQTTIDNQTHIYNYHSFTIKNNYYTNLSKAFPASNLVYLNLANNRIASINEGVFKNLQNMVSLIMSYNDLSIIRPDVFKGVYLPSGFNQLKNLKELRLDHNKLQTLNRNIFQYTLSIEILDLSYNPFKSIDHQTFVAITDLAYLKKLYLQYTEIKTLPDGMLHSIIYLQVLDISGNPLTEMPKTLSESRNLIELYMNNTLFVNLSGQYIFPPMPTVKVLHFCRNQYLHRLGRHSLSGLTSLKDIRLCDNPILSEIDNLAFAEPISGIGSNVWPVIRKLYLGNNKLSYLNRNIIARWDELTELDIRGNPWLCESGNQWLIGELYPLYLKLNGKNAKKIKCTEPTDMVCYNIDDLYNEKAHMRFSNLRDTYADAVIVLIIVGCLAGVLILHIIIGFLLLFYQEQCCNICCIYNTSIFRRFLNRRQYEEI